MYQKLALICLFFLTAVTLSAQDVSLKNDHVMLEGKSILKYKKIYDEQYSFSSLDNENEILLFTWKHNKIPKGTSGGNYIVLNFVSSKIKIETTDVRQVEVLGFSSKKMMIKIIKWVLKEKVVDENGIVNIEKLNIFHAKYNENINTN